MARAGSQPAIGLALGSGGAKGIAHIVVLEALDELGVRPCAIAGSSVGALAGALYAGGMSGREIRAYILKRLTDPLKVAGDLMACGAAGLEDLFSFAGNPILVDGRKLMTRFLPDGFPGAHFEDLRIPLTVVATDYYAKREVVFTSGKLAPALAASISIPGLFLPLEYDGSLLIDGAATNPLPFDLLAERAGLVVAVDVNGGPSEDDRRIGRVPRPLDVLFAAVQILTHAVISEKLARAQPALVLRPDVARFGVLDFFDAPTILKAAEPAKDDLKRALDRLLSAA